MFNANFLFASLFWGSVGVAYFIYGKKQASWIPMIAGLLMIVVSYFVASALLMSLACLGIIVLVYVLLKQGY
jgi:predicted phage tail protein